jgi:hypothetical protein
MVSDETDERSPALAVLCKSAGNTGSLAAESHSAYWGCTGVHGTYLSAVHSLLAELFELQHAVGRYNTRCSAALLCFAQIHLVSSQIELGTIENYLSFVSILICSLLKSAMCAGGMQLIIRTSRARSSSGADGVSSDQRLSEIQKSCFQLLFLGLSRCRCGFPSVTVLARSHTCHRRGVRPVVWGWNWRGRPVTRPSASLFVQFELRPFETGAPNMPSA